MFDTLHLITPRGVQYARDFVPILKDLERRTISGKSGGWQTTGSKQPYRRVANLADYDLPIVLHEDPRFGNKKTGQKLEMIGAGGMGISEMVAAARAVYLFDPSEAEMPRIDCTADVKNVDVMWFRNYVRVRHKRRGREEGRLQKDNTMVCETYYAGKKPVQVRIYDKTGERIAQLKAQRRGMTPQQRHELSLGEMFFQKYKYPMDQVVTRVEHQLGARRAEKYFGVKCFGEIAQMANKPVFRNMVFPDLEPADFSRLKREDVLIVERLLDVRDRDGLRDAMNHYKRHTAPATYWRKKRMFESLLQDSGRDTGVTLESLTEAYRVSSLVQLAA